MMDPTLQPLDEDILTSSSEQREEQRNEYNRGSNLKEDCDCTQFQSDLEKMRRFQLDSMQPLIDIYLFPIITGCRDSEWLVIHGKVF
jgi:hypothetical protein